MPSNQLFVHYAQKNIDDIVKEFQTSVEYGLSTNQAVQSRNKYGTNEIKEHEPKL